MQWENTLIIAGMPTKQQNSYPLRMPAELRNRLEKAAKTAGISVNSLIVQLLQEALDHPPGDLSAFPSATLLHEVLVRYGKLVKIEITGKEPPKKDHG